MSDSVLPFKLPSVPPLLPQDGRNLKERDAVQQAYNNFFSFPVTEAQKSLEETQASEWISLGQKQALNTFHAAAERVPAYKDFLKKHSVQHEKIMTFAEFEQNVPTTNKSDYIGQYPLEALSWDGLPQRGKVIGLSSGTTGEPYAWPRDTMLELEIAYTFELLLESFFNVSKYKTLFVDCFAMGMYVGGVFVLNSTLRTIEKGYNVTITTPGNVMDDVLHVVKTLMPHYEQIILSGYPPFIKDVIENGINKGIEWSNVRTVLLTSSEGFSESWRQHVASMAGIKNPLFHFLSYYAAADAAILGIETPWSVLVRNYLSRNIEDVIDVFGESRLPSFMQYLPTLRYFEETNEELYFTASNGCVPLLRYNIHDHGGIIGFQEMEDILSKKGIEVDSEMRERGVNKRWQLPYVFIHGRSDHTAILYGANIYPEHVKSALEHDEPLKYCTGRFVMEVAEDEAHDEKFIIHVECREGVQINNSLAENIARVIAGVLQDINAEYRNAFKAIGKRAIPRVQLYKYNDSRYFNNTKKQKWKNSNNHVL